MDPKSIGSSLRASTEAVGPEPELSTSNGGAVAGVPPPPRALPTRVARLASDVASPTHVETGDVLAEAPQIPGYDLLEVLGVGGMGVVYKARQVQAGRFVALKTVRTGPDADPRERLRFRTEIEAVAGLQHPHIVPIYEVGEYAGCQYFSMEFAAGGTLEKKLAGQPIAPRDAAQLLVALARAVEFAHRHQVIHRDLKPSNVLISADGTPKISDFGLAKRLESDSGQTRPGEMLGTPGYMAPEQPLGRAGPQSDLYSLGAILYQTLTGRPPHRGVTALETLQQVMTCDPVPPSRLQPHVPRDLETICLKCLQRDPARRYAGAGELEQDLERFLADQPIRARPTGFLGRSTKWARRHPAAAALFAFVALVAAGFVAGLVWHNGRLKESARRQRELAGEAVAARALAETRATEADEARAAAQAEAAEAERQRQLAVDHLARARKAAQLSMKIVRGVLTRQRNTTDLRIDLLEDALKTYEGLPDDADPAVRLEMALVYDELSYAVGRKKERERAAALYAQAVSRLEGLFNEYPDVTEYRWRLARCYGRRGNILRVDGQFTEAERLLRDALEMHAKLIAADPFNSTYRSDVERMKKWLELTLTAARDATDD